MKIELGSVLSLVGAQMTNGIYTAGATQNFNNTAQGAFIAALVFNGASTVTDLRIKLQGRRNTGGTQGAWFDLQGVRSSDGLVSNEFIWLRSNGSVDDMIQFTGQMIPEDIRVVGECTGASPHAADSIKVDGRKVV